MISQRYLIFSLLGEPPLPFPLPSSPKISGAQTAGMPHSHFWPSKCRKKTSLFSTCFFITFQNRILLILDPWFTLKNGPKSIKNAPKAEKVDFSKSGVLPAWEHDSEGFRPPKIIKNHKKIGLKDTSKKATIFRPHFQWFWSILGIPFGVWERSFWVKGGGGRQPPALLEEIINLFLSF